jgi:hypothetical protein
MAPVPPHPALYHITHVDNLPSILSVGGLYSDADLIARGGPVASIGMGVIKHRRLSLPVTCHPGASVGGFVPFYFCPRSIMLFLIHCANHPELTYRGGQAPILHLQFSLDEVIGWAEAQNRRWAFSLSNAGARYAEFRSRIDQLAELDWGAIMATNFRSAEIKEGKQAEFLVEQFVPWHLVERIGVHSERLARQVYGHVAGAAHRPPIEVRREWYF